MASQGLGSVGGGGGGVSGLRGRRLTGGGRRITAFLSDPPPLSPPVPLAPSPQAQRPEKHFRKRGGVMGRGWDTKSVPVAPFCVAATRSADICCKVPFIFSPSSSFVFFSSSLCFFPPFRCKYGLPKCNITPKRKTNNKKKDL